MSDTNVYTTKLSSKGQVVIPESLRDKLGLLPGTQFVVVGKGDTVILKSIEQPSMDEFEALIQDARNVAHKHKLNESDLANAIKEVRKK